jgi:hypothetical protein
VHRAVEPLVICLAGRQRTVLVELSTFCALFTDYWFRYIGFALFGKLVQLLSAAYWNAPIFKHFELLLSSPFL